MNSKAVALGLLVLAAILFTILVTPAIGWSSVTITVVASLILACGIYYLIKTRKVQ